MPAGLGFLAVMQESRIISLHDADAFDTPTPARILFFSNKARGCASSL